MKLLKVLATGAVALAVSTSVMAQSSLEKRHLIAALTCSPGFMPDTGSICAVKGLVLVLRPKLVHADLVPTELEPIQQGVFSTVTNASLGDYGQLTSGSMASRFIRQQAIADASGDYSIGSNVAAFQCARRINSGPGKASYLPSMEQLKALQSGHAALIRGFIRQQEDSQSLGAHLSKEQKELVLNQLKAMASDDAGITLLSSNEDLENPTTHAQTLSSDGTVGSVLKNASTSYICLQSYTPAMLTGRGSLLSK